MDKSSVLRNGGLSLIVALLLVLGGLITEHTILQDNGARFQTRRVCRIYQKKEAQLHEYMERYRQLPERESLQGTEILSLLEDLREDGMILLDYREDSLVFWSDHNLVLLPGAGNRFREGGVHRLRNGWYGIYPEQTGNRLLVGLLKIKHQYSYENDLIKNDFADDFHLPDCASIATASSDTGYEVTGSSGKCMFRIVYSGEDTCFKQCHYIPVFLYLCGLLAFLVALGKSAGKLHRRHGILAGMLFRIIVSSAFYAFMVFLRWPVILWKTELFSPYPFALSGLIPNLGSLLFLSVLGLTNAYLFYRDARLASLFRGKDTKVLLASMFFHLLSVLTFYGVIMLIRLLIIHSSLSFEAFNVLDLNFLSILAFVAIAFFLYSWLFLFSRILLDSQTGEQKNLVLGLIITASALTVLSLAIKPLSIYSVLGFYATGLIIWFIKRMNRSVFHFGLSFLFMVVFATIIMHNINTLGSKKHQEELKVLAVNTDTRQDPIAEYMLVELQDRIRQDSVLVRMLHEKMLTTRHVFHINQYLKERYFSGFWENYDLQVTICSSDSELNLLDEGRQVGCFRYFNEFREEAVSRVEQTDFYYMESGLGRIRFFGAFYFTKAEGGENGLFIDLYSKIAYTPSGYPELLIDERYVRSSALSDYSYALYENDRLVVEAGDFPYSAKGGAVYSQGEKEFNFVNFEGYRHLVYSYSPGEKIVISEPGISPLQTLISFAYILVFLQLLFAFLQTAMRYPEGTMRFRWNFENRLQVLFIGVILLAFTGVGIGAVLLSRQQYENRNYDTISEKMRSVYIELEHKLSEEESLSSGWYNPSYGTLDDLLRKFSNVFYTDINLYDPEGRLIATSRPEIFSRGLSGRRMSYAALNQLNDRSRGEFIQKESLGELTFLSSYVPFHNMDNELLAYLNLPYFSRQKSLTNDISNLVVTIVNFSFLLVLLTMIFTILIANRLTNPLRMIQNRLGSFRLGMKNEYIQYRRKDEIGSLVEVYNRMVDEVSESAEKLARSERELAWREMAKQIAHEIKNPLTPMRLNVQQLERTLRDCEAEDWEERLKRFSRNMIEQIDNLSAIATAFSSFAKMPPPKPEKINLVSKLQSSADLFSNIRNIRFEVDCFGHRHVYVYADKEHLTIVFSNLIKNAIQAIPGNADGLIRIELTVDMDEQKARVHLRDNGSGIPEELRDKLFLPNFTTKSAGMGLGLSITKRIVENAGGTIWFETEVGRGTSFFLEFPLGEGNPNAG